MELELKVKKLERRETKAQEPVNVWCLSVNMDAIKELMNMGVDLGCSPC